MGALVMFVLYIQHFVIVALQHYIVNCNYGATGCVASGGGKQQSWEMQGLQYFRWRDHSRCL
jgi:hypothetical protein